MCKIHDKFYIFSHKLIVENNFNETSWILFDIILKLNLRKLNYDKDDCAIVRG